MRTENVIREDILGLLSDEEVARVSNAEDSPRLRDGEEYIDLRELALGVRKAGPNTGTTGQLLSRSAVNRKTWEALLGVLAKAPPIKH